MKTFVLLSFLGLIGLSVYQAPDVSSYIVYRVDILRTLNVLL